MGDCVGCGWGVRRSYKVYDGVWGSVGVAMVGAVRVGPLQAPPHGTQPTLSEGAAGSHGLQQAKPPRSGSG